MSHLDKDILYINVILGIHAYNCKSICKGINISIVISGILNVSSLYKGQTKK